MVIPQKASLGSTLRLPPAQRAAMIAAILLLALPGVVAFAQNGPDGARRAKAVTDYATPVVNQIPRITRPPKIEDFTNVPADDPPNGFLHLSGFIQQQPTDGAPGSQKTEVYLAFDNSRLYLVWMCFDSAPQRIRAHMSRREAIDTDDYVELLLDTFRDRRHGLKFIANPLGVQADLLYTEDGAIDDPSWDTVWDSEGRVTPNGYVVLMAIPFRSLRFPRGDEHTWGIALERYVAREDEKDFWPRISSRVAGRLSQEGTITIQEAISSGHNLEFNPYFSARSFRTVDDRDPLQPRFTGKTFEPREGLDSKFVLKGSLVLDATVNPDFSQIESDEPQNTVNQRFEVQFPEKRPFFLENSNFFDSEATAWGLTQLIFTRRIADPSAGVRLSGKQGPWNIGLMMADDRGPGEAVPLSDPVAGERAYFAIGRVTHDLGKQSSVGVVFTDREFAGDFNRVGGTDATWRLSRNWTSYFRALVSSTQQAGQNLFGSALESALHGEGRRLFHTFLFQDISPRFQTDPGFLRRADIIRLYDYFHFYFRPENKVLVKWGPETNLERTWDRSGQAVQYHLNGSLFFGFRGNTTLFFPIVTVESDTLRPQDFPGLNANRKFIQDSIGVDFTTTPLRQLSLHVLAYRQGAINLVAPTSQLPNEADETTVNSTLSLKPVTRLSIDNTYILDRVVHNDIGHAVFDNHILRSKWNYQWNRELSFRFIAQYNGLLANPAYTSLTTTKMMNFDFLVTYLLHPGTAIYAGYNSNLENLIPGLCPRLPGIGECDPLAGGLTRDPQHLINNGRQFFIKVSYLFQR
jgi:Domain of unknown function (DUF5916)